MCSCPPNNARKYAKPSSKHATPGGSAVSISTWPWDQWFRAALFRFVPVPDVLVQIKPEWLGLLYFVYDSEIVIVDPSDMRIVAIVPG